jgi:hypothetical protein
MSFPIPLAGRCVVLLSLLSLPLVHAQLVGCDAVQCPLGETAATAACVVGNATLSTIGIANLNSVGANFTWTLGEQSYPVNNDNITDHEQILGRLIYLGSPPNIRLDDPNLPFGACGVFFPNVSNQVVFPFGLSGDIRTGVGTCENAINSSCLQDLLKQAAGQAGALLDRSADVNDLCSQLQEPLQNNPPASCLKYTPGSAGKWTGLQVQGNI